MFVPFNYRLIAEFLLGSPRLAFSNPDMIKTISSNIYEAKKEGFPDAIPQAAMAGVVYCQQHKQVLFILYIFLEMLVIDALLKLQSVQGVCYKR